MTTTRDIAWVAGLLEGEGCFVASGRRIDLTSTDYDVVSDFKKIIGCHNTIQTSMRNAKRWKRVYRISVCGSLAVQWSMTIYPLTKTRRRSEIKELLDTWKSSNYGTGMEKSKWHLLKAKSLHLSLNA